MCTENSHNSSPTNLEYKRRGLMVENNVCKTIDRKYMLPIPM